MPSQEKPDSVDFASSLEKLDSLVQRIESGELSLEESLKVFEEGISLTKQCQTILREAEQKVQILTSNDQLENVHHP